MYLTCSSSLYLALPNWSSWHWWRHTRLSHHHSLRLHHHRLTWHWLNHSWSHHHWLLHRHHRSHHSWLRHHTWLHHRSHRHWLNHAWLHHHWLRYWHNRSHHHRLSHLSRSHCVHLHLLLLTNHLLLINCHWRSCDYHWGRSDNHWRVSSLVRNLSGLSDHGVLLHGHHRFDRHCGELLLLLPECFQLAIFVSWLFCLSYLNVQKSLLAFLHGQRVLFIVVRWESKSHFIVG